MTELTDEVRAQRQRFDVYIQPHRPSLWKYCYGLTGSEWEAEDLVQETLLKAFARLAYYWQPLNPLGYLFRVANTVWLDRLKREKVNLVSLDEGNDEPAIEEHDPVWVETALHALVRLLPPRERAAVLLADVFQFTMAEAAEVMGVSPGALQAALSRGRAKLKRFQDEPTPAEELVSGVPARTPEMQRFIDAFNARDADRMAELLSESCEVDIVGVAIEWGREEARKSSLTGIVKDPETLVAEVGRIGEDEVVFIYSILEGGTKALTWISRFEMSERGIERWRSYYFCPELIERVAGRLGVPAFTHGHHYFPLPEIV